ncbi:MAG TPA: class I SAM-dependent methyltransferase [Solirubrobacteraceae bacterium]|jgi:SAM-dependent methyltransferase|nr:class I SAM-dependent methyltransferase [Solirubrobacteraceae bacterium]
MDIETYAEQHPQFASEDVELHLLEWLARSDFSTLLDVGCGSGRLISALLSKGLLDPASSRGVDLSQSQIDRFRVLLPGFDVVVDDAQSLQTVPDHTIDFLISTQVLEHVDDARMMAAVRRVLAPGGIAYISTVSKRRWARFIWRNQNSEWSLDPTHVREYTDDAQLLRLLDPMGPTLIDSRKVPVSYSLLDFVIRRLRLDPERVFALPIARIARRARVRIPGYFIWSLVFRMTDTR